MSSSVVPLVQERDPKSVALPGGSLGGPAQAEPMSQEQAVQLFSISPALFVENQGQWADVSVRYAYQGSGPNVAMTGAGPVFQVFRREAIQA